MSTEFDFDPHAADYYERLGLSQDADSETITKAGKHAFSEYHPDSSSLPKETAEEYFMRLKDAKEVLKDSDTRAAYDTFIDRFGKEKATKYYEDWENTAGSSDPQDWSPPNQSTTDTAAAGNASTTNSESTTRTNRETARRQTTTTRTDDRKQTTTNKNKTTRSGDQKTRSGSTNKRPPPNISYPNQYVTSISSIDRNGDWCEMVVVLDKIAAPVENAEEMVAQGQIRDVTGTTRLTIWSDSDVDAALTESGIYYLQNVVTERFQGRYELKAVKGSEIIPIKSSFDSKYKNQETINEVKQIINYVSSQSKTSINPHEAIIAGYVGKQRPDDSVDVGEVADRVARELLADGGYAGSKQYVDQYVTATSHYPYYKNDTSEQKPSPTDNEVESTAPESPASPYTASWVPRRVAEAFERLVHSPAGWLFTMRAPRSWLARALLATVGFLLLAMLVSGVSVVWRPITANILLLSLLLWFTTFPRFSPWFFAVWTLLFATGDQGLAVLFAVYLALSLGYFAFIRGSNLDPYATSAS